MKMKIKTGKYTDYRDNKTYTIAKMPDGKYWFTQNLAYNPKKKGHWKRGNEHYYTWELAQKVAPKGWRLPSRDDFVTLDKAVGGAGKFQRVGGSNFWRPGGDFKGSYSGLCYTDGSLSIQGSYSHWWSSSPYSSSTDYAYSLLISSSNVYPDYFTYRGIGLTVRLVSDALPKGAVMDGKEMTVICSESHRLIFRKIEIPVKVICSYQFDIDDVEEQIREKLERQA
jgi:uncharacterized protein (TIGR02145 family)